MYNRGLFDYPWQNEVTMLAPVLFILNVVLITLNTAVCSVLIFVCACLKFLLPLTILKKLSARAANKMMWVWATGNAFIFAALNRVEWDIEGVETLSKEGWYLMISNHSSWTDIVVLCCVFKDRIPMPKFFLKQQLMYIPFIGMACWALDMPFMRRYSREYLIRHPEKRGLDLETTRRSCERFKDAPTTVVNYVEGTRFTSAKQLQGGARYQHLLAPKSGGIAYTLAAMGEQFENIIDVTVAYPKNTNRPFYDVLMGRMEKVVVRVKVLPVDEQVSGDYFNDKPYKRRFQQWLTNLWEEKDAVLTEVHTKQSELDKGLKNKL